VAIFFLAEHAGERLDHYLQARMSGYSRARLQAWIKDGLVSVNGGAAKPSTTLRSGDRIEVSPADLPPLKADPEDAPIEILYEDAAVIAVNKPAGLVVHAGAGTFRDAGEPAGASL
jgi:23S rRNA-/tRNA-specific pseudouridylate synthase